jgi:cellulose biosynthesis protein BcsQ
MTGKVIAIANMKGGVGKTATVIGLAEALAAEGAETLVVDLDAQANASICLAGDAILKEIIENGQTIDAFLDDRFFGGARDIRIDPRIRTHISNVSHLNRQLPLSLLAASSELRLLERKLIFGLTKMQFDFAGIVEALHSFIREQFRRSRRRYDYILVDCAPGISALTEVSIRLADLVVVPTIPDFLSTYGLHSFCSNLWSGDIARRSTLRKPKRPCVLVTRKRPTREHAQQSARLRLEARQPAAAFGVFETEIFERAAIAEALGKVEAWPSFSQKWRDGTSAVLESLMAEVKDALHGP